MRPERLLGAARRQHRDPVLDDRVGVAVNFQPRERLTEYAATGEGPLASRAGAKIVQSALKRQDLAEPLHVAASERQLAEAGSRLAP